MYGTPAPQSPKSPTPGQPLVPVTLDALTPPANLPAGVSPRLSNWQLDREGLAPVLGMSVVGGSGLSSSHSWSLNAPGLLSEWFGGNPNAQESAAVVFGSGGTLLYWHPDQYWARMSYGTNSVNDPNTSAIQDSTVIYEPVADENALVFCNRVEQPYIWPGVNYASSRTYSTLTNAVPALACAYFDTRVVFGNVLSGTTIIPQRVVFSARGDPQLYAAPDGGIEDLVSMRGGIVKLVEDGDRLVIIGEYEIWEGRRAPFPFNMIFQPLDRTIGCGEARTVAQTPKGIVFQGHDGNVYILPKGSASAIAIGDKVWPDLKRLYDPAKSNRGFGLYDAHHGKYHVYPATVYYPGPSAGDPQFGFVLDMETMAWSTRSVGANRVVHGHYMRRENSSANALPYFITSQGTVARMGDTVLRTSLASASTSMLGSTISGSALFPIGNPDPSRRVYVDSVLIDYSNRTCASGSSITIHCSSDFGQTSDFSVGVALPHTVYSRQTVVRLAYQAVYPSIDIQYESQKSINALRIQRITAMIGQGGASA